MKKALSVLALSVLVALAVWFGLSCMLYRFEHPEMTETQLFLHIPDALAFRE